MAKRPTDGWREQAGLRGIEGSNSAVHPAPWIAATEHVLAAFEDEVQGFETPSDGEVFAAVQRVVEGLNDVDEAHDDHDFDTIDREELCEFIDSVLSEAGVDLDALAARRGVERSEITGEWREW